MRSLHRSPDRIPLIVQRDHPGRSLVLRWHGDTLGVLALALLLVACCLIAVLTGVLVAAAPNSLWYGMVALLLLMLGVLVATGRPWVLLVSVDRDAGTLVLRTVRYRFFPLRTSVPLSSLSSLDLHAGELDRQVYRITLTLRQEGGRTRRETFCVVSLDSRKEVLDLAFRMGTIAELLHYRVHADDPQRFDVTVSRTDPEGGKDVPPIDRPAHYEIDRVASALDPGTHPTAAPSPAARPSPAAWQRIPAVAPSTHRPLVHSASATDVSHQPADPFDPSAFSDRYTITAWEPGAEVRLEEKVDIPLWVPPFLFVFFGLALIATVPGLFSDIHGRRADKAPCVVIFSLFMTVFSAIGTVGAIVDRRNRRATTFDWRSREITTHSGEARKAIPFGALSFLLLRGLSWKRTEHHRGFVPNQEIDEYRCDLYASWGAQPDGPQHADMLVSMPACRNRDEAYRRALSFSQPLAKALSVPLRFSDFPPPRV